MPFDKRSVRYNVIISSHSYIMSKECQWQCVSDEISFKKGSQLLNEELHIGQTHLKISYDIYIQKADKGALSISLYNRLLKIRLSSSSRFCPDLKMMQVWSIPGRNSTHGLAGKHRGEDFLQLGKRFSLHEIKTKIVHQIVMISSMSRD